MGLNIVNRKILFKKTELYKILMLCRNELAEQYSCSAHNVCNNKVLALLANIK